jgi:hypothetical protein
VNYVLVIQIAAVVATTISCVGVLRVQYTARQTLSLNTGRFNATRR